MLIILAFVLSPLTGLYLAQTLSPLCLDIEQIFGLMPSDAAKTYHDINYGLIMLSKIYSVHMVNALGHDILFSDVDIALYRDPVQYFEERAPPNFDMYFQHDGFHHPKRFARE
jgi:hypothetical protein